MRRSFIFQRRNGRPPASHCADLRKLAKLIQEHAEFEDLFWIDRNRPDPLYPESPIEDETEDIERIFRSILDGKREIMHHAEDIEQIVEINESLLEEFVPADGMAVLICLVMLHSFPESFELVPEIIELLAVFFVIANITINESKRVLGKLCEFISERIP